MLATLAALTLTLFGGSAWAAPATVDRLEVVEGQDVVIRIAEGDRIDTIRLVGDPTGILSPHAEMVSVWNRMLDAADDPRVGG